MPTTVNLRKILDAKRWEVMNPAPVATTSATFVVSSYHYRQQQLYVTSNTAAHLYNPSEDAWAQVPSPALAGTFGAGACGIAHSWSTGSTVAAASLTATSGTTSTIVTNQTLARDLRGYSVQILSGPNAGATLTISSNTIGTNATITVPAQASAFSASTVFRLMTPRFYVLGAGTLASGSFRVYDFATNTWQTLSQTGLPASVATDGRLVSTPSWIGTDYNSMATGTATSATSTTLVNSAKNWTPSQWVNAQVRITGGTGAGQIRTITANDATSITVATWTTTPDATSTYAISGNDDFLYFLGNNAVTLYRYSISANTWSTLTPGAARSGAPGAGMSGSWISQSTDSAWTAENSIINGRRIYSFRGAASTTLDYYDIAANTWVSALTYAPATETLTTGTKWALIRDQIYVQKDATGRWFRYNVVTSEQDGWSVMPALQGAALLGDTAWDVRFIDGATEVAYVYMILNTSSIVLRCMVI
jgi:hypothetical protein